MKLGWAYLLATVTAISGCASRGVPYPGPNRSLQTGYSQLDSARVLPASYEAPASNAALQDWESGKIAEPSAHHHQALTEKTAACLAAQQSVLANLLDGEHDSVDCLNQDCDSANSADLRHDMLSLRALDQRNRDAGIGLTLFYRLAEASQGRQMVTRGVPLVDDSLAQLRNLRTEGIAANADEGVLQRQRLDLDDRRVIADLAVGQIQERIWSLLNVERGGDPLWPQFDVEIETAAVDVGNAIRTGLVQRADLAITRLLVCRLDAGSLPAARQGLQSVDIGLGAVLPTLRPFKRLFGPRVACCDVEVRQQQLEQLLERQTRQVEAEIRQAALEVDSRLAQIVVARRKFDSLRQTVATVRQQRTIGGAKPLDVLTAELEALRGERELFEKFIAWKIAAVNLREKQGLLTIECGYPSPAGFLAGCDDST